MKRSICVVCANKSDLPQQQVSREQGQKWAQENGFYFFELSAQSGENVVTTFNLLIDKIATAAAGG
jgi:hypothetical protein